MASVNSPSEYSSRGQNSNGPVIQEEESSFSLVDILENVFFFRWYFIGTFAIIASFSVFYALLASPIYVADALIQVEEKKGSQLGALSQVAKALDVQQSPVLGEIEIIRSRTVIGSAIEALHANIGIEVNNRLPIIGNWLARILGKDTNGLTRPLWSGSSLSWGGEELRIQKMVVPPRMYGLPFILRIGAGNTWELFDDDGTKLLTGKGIEQESEVDLVGGGTISLRLEQIKARPGNEFKLVTYSMLSRISQLLGQMTVAETKRQSGIIKMTFEDRNPSRAAQMLNAVARAYVEQNVSRRSEEAERSLAFLNRELPRLKADLELSEQNLNEYRNQKKSIDIPGEIRELLTQTTNTEKSRLELEIKRKELATRFEPDYPMIKAIDAQLATVNSQSSSLNKEISRLPQVQQDYIRKARDVEVNNQLYVSLLNNAQQLQIAKAGTVGNVAIVDSAVSPERPSRPNKVLTVAIGALLGLILGFVVCQVIALLAGIVRDPKKLEQAVSLATLGIIPLSSEQIEAVDDFQIATDKGDKEQHIFLLAKEKPSSVVSEALRSLRTSLIFTLSEKSRSKVILLTSAVPSQGKSFISANLSYLFAVTGKRVILVEADVRRASIKRYIKFDTAGPGLSSVLINGASLEDTILKEVYPNMDFLPAGPRVKNPGDMLATDALQNILNTLASTYDYVIIDSPPLLPVNDARSLAKAADVTLFVARQEMVSLSEINEAIEVFGKAGSYIDGLIFNGFVPSVIRYGYRYGYGYGGGYWRYGGKYGRYGGKYGRYGGKYGRYGRKYGGYGTYGSKYGDDDDASKK